MKMTMKMKYENEILIGNICVFSSCFTYCIEKVK